MLEIETESDSPAGLEGEIDEEANELTFKDVNLFLDNAVLESELYSGIVLEFRFADMPPDKVLNGISLTLTPA